MPTWLDWGEAGTLHKLLLLIGALIVIWFVMFIIAAVFAPGTAFANIMMDFTIWAINAFAQLLEWISKILRGIADLLTSLKSVDIKAAF